MQAKISISDGNRKMGNVPSVSLVPVLDCVNCDECKRDCYALKAYRMYKQTRDAYHRNSDLAHESPGEFFSEIEKYLARKKPTRFRYHVAGDILDQDYLDRMCALATRFPATKFLAFTKHYNLDWTSRPSNLTVILSCWPKLALPRNKTLPRAYMQDGTETRIPAKARKCPGSCEKCSLCFNAKNSQAVVFHKH